MRVLAIGIGDYMGTVTSPSLGPVIDASTELEGISPILGTGYDGQVLTAGTLTPVGATATYQWQRSELVNGIYEDIPGATSNTYTPTPDDVDYFIKVVATGSGIYSGSVSAVIGPIRSSTIPVTDIGPISGTTVVGQTLTAGDLTPADATVTYQWFRCNTANGFYSEIEGATSRTYTLTQDDLGKYIKVSATGIDGYSRTVTSQYTGPVIEETRLVPLDSIGPIAGIAQVGQTLTAGALSPAGATATYQWLRADTANGTYSEIAGAVSKSYTLTVADFGKFIKVRATGSGTYTGTVLSAATSAVAPCPITAIGPISGSTIEGQTLTAGAVTPAGATVSYQWSRSMTDDGTYTNIAGASSSTYTLVPGDVNYYIKVTATGTGAYSGSVTSLYTGPVTTGLGGLYRQRYQ